MPEGSRFDRCSWHRCQTSCVDEIELCAYHFRLAGETFIEKRSIFGAAAMTERRERREREAAERAASMPVADPDAWSRRRSVVYYVRVGDHVKIGYTTHLRSRVCALRVDKDAVLAVEPGWKSREAKRHAQFAAERQGRRENFNPSPRLLKHIEAIRSQFGEPYGYAQRRIDAAGPKPVAKAPLLFQA